MLEKFFNIHRLINGLGFGPLIIMGGGKGKETKEVVADYHITEKPKVIDLKGGAKAEFSVVRHDGYQTTGTVTITQVGKAGVKQDFSLQKGQSLQLSEGTILVHKQRKK